MLYFLPTASTETRDKTENFVKIWLSDLEVYSLQTSGSTGIPKRIEVERSRMAASAQATIAALGLEIGKPAILGLSVEYIAGQMAMVRAMELNWDIYATDPAADMLATWTLEEPPYHASMVPLQLETAMQDPVTRKRLEGMHSVLVGGAPPSPSVEAAAAEMQGVALYQTFGMTETVSHIALRRLNGPDVSSFYTMLPGHEAKLDDRGCLMVRGVITNDVWIETNDLVELTADGTQFRWLGRADFTINSGGIKMQPEMLEEAVGPLLKRFGLSGAFYITARPDERLGSHVTLVVEGVDVDMVKLQYYLNGSMPLYMTPKEIEVVEKIPRTRNGKLLRK